MISLGITKNLIDVYIEYRWMTLYWATTRSPSFFTQRPSCLPFEDIEGPIGWQQRRIKSSECVC